MKILIPLKGFFPAQNYGGPPVSILNICNLLNDSVELFIIASDHDLKSKTKLDGLEEGWNKKYNVNIKYLSDEEKNYKVFEQIIKEISPDWIYLNSLFDAAVILPFLKLAKRYNIRTLLAPRGELNQGAFRKKYKKLPYIAYIKPYLKKIYFQSTCDEETAAIRKWLCRHEERICVLPNVPTIPSGQYIHGKRSGEMRVLFFSRICEKKNLYFALECMRSIKSGRVVFDIYGPIENEEYWKRCQKVIMELPSNICVEYKGTIRHEEVYSVISEYDLFFFPTFSENYGHVIAEALFAGLPILISDQTPWTDVNNHGAGKALPLDNKKEYAEYLEYLVSCDSVAYKKISNCAYQFVSEKSNLEEIKKMYEDVFYD